ncbi:3-phosphoshikimate 1-carboxyvinyltransferase [uncultured Ruminococcus sp.]|uniref:3-phosphoshikimate 1-carboxyvinyltransferase n=1 Tax=uncultured Ruminococcus sp. TaxID=165186 RepID=UPI0026039DA0|nr:3-phosphoshikimate 1-carboxyvinyltransferase [uncultured Ruminococcus sp.]
MDIRIEPSQLRGTVDIPASKSCAHRALISAALAGGISVISGVSMSKDIEATIGAMTALGAEFSVDGTTITVSGISSRMDKAVIDCNESGSTLRFVIPIAAALGTDSRFIGRGRLPQRPIDIYTRELGKNGVKFLTETMPYDITGTLKGGIFEIEGNVSSQFVTGLLFALPLLEGNSEIRLTSHLESRPYVDITIDILRRFGITVESSENGFRIAGGQKYKPYDYRVEGDYSQAAFFYVANALGSEVNIANLVPDSVQGDRKILEILNETCYNGSIGCYRADCSDIPDLVPILAVLGAFGSGESVIYNAQRLRIKESDRLVTTAAMLNELGGDVAVTEDGLIIRPTGRMHGGTIDSAGDHRIVMAAAIAATKTDGAVIIRGAEAAEKSYPDFFKDYIHLGGKANVIDLE